jgi:hypothetical protein
MKRFAVAFISCTLTSTAALAQMVPSKWPVATMEAKCRVNQSGRDMNPDYCNRTAVIARSRYGNDVTMYQWNSAVGVVRNQIRQDNK